MDTKYLVKQLLAKLQKADETTKTAKYKNMDLSKYKECSLNPKYIKTNQYYQICELHDFVKENEFLTRSELEYLLRQKVLKFKFLRELQATIPDLADELKDNGPQNVARKYIEACELYEIVKKSR